MAGKPPLTVLIIDDDEAKRYAVAKILRKAGYAIREGATGAEALRLAAEKPALIILDVKLPDVSGFEVCRRIKADPATAIDPRAPHLHHLRRHGGSDPGPEGRCRRLPDGRPGAAGAGGHGQGAAPGAEAEEAAQISTSQWQVTFDAINDGVVLLDREGAAIQVNSALEGMLGKTWNELAGQEIHDLFPTGRVPEESPFLRMLGTGRRETVELRLAERWLRVDRRSHSTLERGPQGGRCASSRTSPTAGGWKRTLRQRAEELAAADRRKDEFLAMLAHELRNPLAPIANALEAIRLLRG